MSQQVTKEKYSIETLRERNVSYDHQHWLTQKDVDMANNYVELIERTRSEITPQIGDRLVYVTEHGDYYGNALIDSRSAKEGYLSVCEQPYVPFVWEEDGNIRLSVSGGAFHSVNPEELKFLKWTEGVFKDWGHCGACANGSVSFLAKVPLWFYAEPNPRYGDFTTETYRKFYLHKREESENGNLYQGFDIAFRDEAEFRQFLKDYEGTVFKGNWDNQIVLWCFRREYVFLPSAEWETFNAPIETRRLNFYPEQVKIVKDMEKHITYFYRIKPDNFQHLTLTDMQTTTAPKAGNAPDLLQGILSVQVRNEDKITEQDRVYCQTQQNLLYKTLDQIDRWYAVFKEEAEQYQAERKFHYEENGKVSMRDFYTYHNDREDYSHNEFKPFDLINDLVDKNRNANANFANRIISYFNRTYKVSVPEYKIDEKNLPMGFRPVYDTYVDVVIEHLGGKSFRETAVEELLARLSKVVRPAYWSKVKTELKKDKIIFPEIIRFDDFSMQYNQRNRISYNYGGELETLCAGIAYGADDILNGNSKMIIRFDDNDISVTDWYDLTTTNAEQIRFYKNGRIDVRFKDSAAAESCFKRLHLDEITLREN